MGSESMSTPSSPDRGHPTHERRRWTWSRPDRPWITTHAADRWNERTPWWSHSPEYAYTASVPNKFLTDELFSGYDYEEECRFVPERVRFFGEKRGHEWYAMVILIRPSDNDGGVWTTCYQVCESNLPDCARCHIYTLLHRKGHLDTDSEPHEGAR